MTRHVIEMDDLSSPELAEVLSSASDAGGRSQVMEGLGAALVFEEASARTRNSAEMAVVALGGHPVSISAHEVGIDSRESAEDGARTLACYHAVICARVADHLTLLRMAGALDASGTGVPVINVLSDRSHPGQALADLLTLRQEFGDRQVRPVAYVGDANNVWRSLGLGAATTGMELRTASPDGFGPTDDDRVRVESAGGVLRAGDDPVEAVQGAVAANRARAMRGLLAWLVGARP